MPPVKKPLVNVTTIRLDPAIKAALAQAAWEHRRASSETLRLVLEAWLLERGYLRKTPDGWIVPERKAIINPPDDK
jgi:hypothetical protein